MFFKNKIYYETYFEISLSVYTKSMLILKPLFYKSFKTIWLFLSIKHRHLKQNVSAVNFA